MRLDEDMKAFLTKLTQKYPELFKLVKFGMVGVVNTLVDWLVFALLSLLAFFSQSYWATKAISYSCGLVNSFFMNRKFTFNSNVKLISLRGLRFVLANLFAYGVSLAIIYFADAQFGVKGVWGNVIATPFTIVINFILTRIFVFNDKKGGADDAEEN